MFRKTSRTEVTVIMMLLLVPSNQVPIEIQLPLPYYNTLISLQPWINNEILTKDDINGLDSQTKNILLNLFKDSKNHYSIISPLYTKMNITSRYPHSQLVGKFILKKSVSNPNSLTKLIQERSKLEHIPFKQYYHLLKPNVAKLTLLSNSRVAGFLNPWFSLTNDYNPSKQSSKVKDILPIVKQPCVECQNVESQAKELPSHLNWSRMLDMQKYYKTIQNQLERKAGRTINKNLELGKTKQSHKSTSEKEDFPILPFRLVEQQNPEDNIKRNVFLSKGWGASGSIVTTKSDANENAVSFLTQEKPHIFTSSSWRPLGK